MELDDKDKALLARLAVDGRASNRDLARCVGLSPSACLTRVKRLEDNGYIVGYRAILAAKGSGRRLEAWADIRLVDPTIDSTDQFVRLIARTPEVIEAHRVAGSYDYAIRFCAGDFEAWNTFRRDLEQMGCEAQARITVLLEPLKLI